MTAYVEQMRLKSGPGYRAWLEAREQSLAKDLSYVVGELARLDLLEEAAS